MEISRIVEILNSLRKDWMAKKNDSFFSDRGEWLTGVIKGIDLSIWAITTEATRPKKPPV